MFFKDYSGHSDKLEYTGSNTGYSVRGRPTKMVKQPILISRYLSRREYSNS